MRANVGVETLPYLPRGVWDGAASQQRLQHLQKVTNRPTRESAQSKTAGFALGIAVCKARERMRLPNLEHGGYPTMKIKVNLISACVLLALSGSHAIAQDSDVAEAMIAEGAPAAMAKCMVGKLGDDAERLFSASDDELSDEDTATLVAALEACSDVDGGE
jgi:hypothetical protein